MVAAKSVAKICIIPWTDRNTGMTSRRRLVFDPTIEQVNINLFYMKVSVTFTVLEKSN